MKPMTICSSMQAVGGNTVEMLPLQLQQQQQQQQQQQHSTIAGSDFREIITPTTLKTFTSAVNH